MRPKIQPHLRRQDGGWSEQAGNDLLGEAAADDRSPTEAGLLEAGRRLNDAVEGDGNLTLCDEVILGQVVEEGEAAAIFASPRHPYTRGLLAAEFESEFGQSPRTFFGPAIDRLTESGLLDEAGGGDLRLSARGRLLADSVFAEFV